jgi:hypothetical protein
LLVILFDRCGQRTAAWAVSFVVAIDAAAFLQCLAGSAFNMFLLKWLRKILHVTIRKTRMKRTQKQGQKQRYGARAFPAQILRQTRKFPTIFENNVAITKDVDDDSDKTGQGDLAVQGVLFTDTIGENTSENGVNIVSPLGLKSAALNIEEQPMIEPPKTGQILNIRGTPFTADGSTAAGTAVKDWSAVNIQAPTVQALNDDVTYPSAVTLRVEGPPTGAGVVPTDSYAIRVMDGPVLIEQATNDALTLRGGIECSTADISDRVRLGRANILPPPPTEGADGYELSLPRIGPQGEGDVVVANAGGQLAFATVSLFSAWSGPSTIGNLTIWTDVGYSVGGTVQVTPVKQNGDAIFSAILVANASPMENTNELASMPLTSLKSISADKKSITFNVLTGAISVVGNSTLQHAPEGTQVSVSVMGVGLT